MSHASAVTDIAHVPVGLTPFNCACANKNGQVSHPMFFCLFYVLQFLEVALGFV
jgi:hypothetical protein